MPNPWDLGSARILERLGFPALATTSAGAAWALGMQDARLALDESLAHLSAVAAAVAVPVSADFQGGYAVEPDAVAGTVAVAVETGVAGLSIEDATGDAGSPLYERALAVERVRAAREAIDRSGTRVLLTARSEGYVVGHPDLDDTVDRLVAYAQAGADCLYAPRISTRAEISAIVEAVAPKPVNLLVNAPWITVAEAAALGVRRISVGGTLARAAWGGWLGAAREIAEQGTFGGFRDLPDVEALLADEG
ncbi:isocitrate lyase/phosphoenolpyruvate mutase family protein [Agrococcus sediminis]|uniref:Isocitrate lyase/phosphoenolpyruvate mutase family protein n=2 Tax=Agrococcus sediminis TaxID=2599924 RepID=A0A5M8Q8Y5_9MICO|nr:isocitrate lyase/phosphoenolpyruvate mutase family protein [Agrococcus sediminis]